MFVNIRSTPSQLQGLGLPPILLIVYPFDTYIVWPQKIKKNEVLAPFTKFEIFAKRGLEPSYSMPPWNCYCSSTFDRHTRTSKNDSQKACERRKYSKWPSKSHPNQIKQKCPSSSNLLVLKNVSLFAQNISTQVHWKWNVHTTQHDHCSISFWPCSSQNHSVLKTPRMCITSLLPYISQ